MRSVRLLALASAFLAIAPAFAQDQFPDVPANHWAYEALLRMKKDGLLVGYPDGLFRGGRPASRYELAVAMHAVYTKLKDATDGLDAQIKALNGNQGVSKGDVQALKDAIAALQTQLAALSGYGADIADLRRASDTFEKELTQLGVDVQAMKDDLKNLAGRVQTLENKQPKIAISGDLTLWLGGGHGLDDVYGLNRDGRLTGVSDKGPQATTFAPVPNQVGITDDLAALSEAAITLSSTNLQGVRFTSTFVATNAFGQAPGANGVPSTNVGFGNQSDVFNPSYGADGNPSLLGYGEGTGDVYVQELAASFSGRRYDVQAGRVRHKANPWIFQRIDNTLYFDNDRWDDGKYTMDGFVARTRFGPVGLEAYGGRDSSVNSTNGVRINPLRSGAINGPFATGGVGDAQRLEADRTLGATLTTSVKGVALRGDILRIETSTPLVAVGTSIDGLDTLDVYGGEASFGIGRFKFDGGLRQSAAGAGGGHIEGLADNAWDAKVRWASERFDLSAGYRQVGLNYLAPGDWGRLGVLRNPTNVRGFLGSAKVAFSPKYTLGLEGEISHGLKSADATGSFFGRDTDIQRFGVRLDARLVKGFGTYATYERTRFSDLLGASLIGTPLYQWYGLGLTHSMGENARFSLAYEQSAIRSDYQTNQGVGGTSFRGGFLTTQVTVKF